MFNIGANSNRHIVYYGAGAGCEEELDWIDIWKSERPEVYGGAFICDIDTKKHGTYVRGIPVVSLADAAAKLDNFDIYLTVTNHLRASVSEYLLGCGIAEERIINFAKQERFFGCKYINSWLNFKGGELSPCCAPPLFGVTPPKALVAEEFAGAGNHGLTSLLNNYFASRDSFAAAIKNGEKTTCAGCPALQDETWNLEKAYEYVGFILDGPCNLKCNYCMCIHGSPESEARQKFSKAFDFGKAINLMVKLGIISSKTLINLATGEISVNKKADEILDAVERCRHISVPTNAVAFNERVAKLCSRSGNDITVTVDAGTSETYRKIKGVDAFAKVKANLEKYVGYNTNIIARYIFLPENSNEVDVDGFVDLAKSLGVKMAVITCDVYRTQIWTDEQIKLVRRMKHKLEEQNVQATVTSDILSRDEVDKIGSSPFISYG